MARSSSAKNASARKGSARKGGAAGSGQNLRGNASRGREAAPAAPSVRQDGAERDILGVVLGVVAVASFIAVVSSSSAPVTSAISSFYHLGFGLGAYVLPLVILAAAVCLFLRDRSPVSGRTAAGAVLVFCAILGLLALSTPYTSLSTDAMFTDENLASHGGYVGAFLASALQGAFGKAISRVILIGAIIGGFVIIGFSISALIQELVDRFQELREGLREERERRRIAVNDSPWGDAEDDRMPMGGEADARAAGRRRRAVADDAGKTSYLGSRMTTVIERDEAPEEDEDPLVDVSDQLAAERAKTVLIPVRDRFVQVDEPIEVVGAHRAPSDGQADATSAGGGQASEGAQDTPVAATIPAGTETPRTASAAPAATTVLPARQTADRAPAAAKAPRRIAALRTLFADAVDGGDDAGADDDAPQWEGPFTPFAVDEDLDVPVGTATTGPAATLPPFLDLNDETPVQARADVVPAGSEEPDGTREVAGSVCPPAPEAGDAAAQAPEGADTPPWDAPHAGDIPSFLKASPAVSDAPVKLDELEESEGEDSQEAAPGGQAAPASTARTGASKRAAKDGATGSEDGPRRLPPISMLRHNPNSASAASTDQELEQTAEGLQSTLAEFNLHARVVGWISGPTVTTFKVQPGEGERVSRIVNLEDDIALSLASQSVRIFAPIPGTSLVGIEIPNRKRQNVNLADVLPYVKGGPLELAIGRDAEGAPVVADLAKMPHLLIAGTTGSGKSVMINSIIMTLLMRTLPEDVRLIMVDPKRVELAGYNGLPHLYVPVVTEPKQAASALQWAVSEMERRLKIFERLSVRKISTYNEKQAAGAFAHYDNPPQKMPYLVIIIDELSDLMMVAGKDIEASIVRIAQLGRAAGIHLIVATQRPSSNVVTGLIKANITNRIAFNVATGVDSRVIIDQVGAEKLTGLGDMLFSKVGWGKPKRIQGCFVSDEEIFQVVEFVKEQGGPDYHEEILSAVAPASVSGGAPEPQDDDPLLWEAAHIVVNSQLGSTSGLQRRLKVGYARAGRIMDMLEEHGIVGPPDGSKPREVLLDEEGLAALEALESPLTAEELEG